MAADPVTAGLELATAAVQRIWPDKTEQQARELAAQMQIVQGQLDINRAEAGSAHWFTAGWRPAVGWVCVAALASHYIARPLLQWTTVLTGHPLPELPGIDSNLWELMLGMLGLGGLRTFEKTRRVAS